MRKLMISTATLLASAVFADNIADSDKLLCSSNRITMCFESGECYDAHPSESSVPQFLIVDIKNKKLSTTKASGENRTSPIRTMTREGGLLVLQGYEGERAFSVVVDEATGILTGSVSTDGLTLSIFGACTDTDLD